MQKHAFMEKTIYDTVFDPLPVESDAPIYFDKELISLPYLEDFTHLHYHDRYEIGVCYGGEGLFISGTDCVTINEGDVIFIPPQLKHYSRSLREDNLCICRFVYVNADLVHACMSRLKTSKNDNNYLQIPCILRPSEHEFAVNLLRDIVNDCDWNTEMSVNIIATSIALFLLKSERWFSLSEAYGGYRECESNTEIKISPAAEYISLHYNDDISSFHLAELCHLSESQMRRNFLLAYGKTPVAYRNNLRMRIGEELLSRTDMPISDIAYHLGFQSPSDFSRMFKKHFGVSPVVYKKVKNDK